MTDRPQALCGKAMIPSSTRCSCPPEHAAGEDVLPSDPRLHRALSLLVFHIIDSCSDIDRRCAGGWNPPQQAAAKACGEDLLNNRGIFFLPYGDGGADETEDKGDMRETVTGRIELVREMGISEHKRSIPRSRDADKYLRGPVSLSSPGRMNPLSRVSDTYAKNNNSSSKSARTQQEIFQVRDTFIKTGNFPEHSGEGVAPGESRSPDVNECDVGT
ncbi:unnamed protein product [Pleuronectes platessa]|uniref:Uncharacterized protein n=1 Tax=Pleuronectes platessa TaxID=8262 RepID=A0A9N7TJN3_PLEPL|nr:unnamed protein product [Pleuronectes platessa]